MLTDELALKLRLAVTAACAERDARIAELEKECDRLETYWNKCLADCKNIAERDARINELERQLAEANKIKAAAENLVKVRGRYHTEQAFKALEAAMKKEQT